MPRRAVASVLLPRTPAELLALALFGPTLLYNLAMYWLRPATFRAWWTPIDDAVLLGAVPWPWVVPALAGLGVRGVVNTCAEYAGPRRAYSAYAIEQLHVPTTDFQPPSLADVVAAVDFMLAYANRRERVYCHCKAGRGRSATVALCYLIRRYGVSPEEAQRRLSELRPQVVPDLYRRPVVQEFAASLAPAAPPSNQIIVSSRF